MQEGGCPFCERNVRRSDHAPGAARQLLADPPALTRAELLDTMAAWIDKVIAQYGEVEGKKLVES